MAYFYIPMNKLQNIDRFYFYLAATLAVLAVLIIMVLKTIFGAVSTATTLDRELLEASTPKLDRKAFNEAVGHLQDQEAQALDLRQ